MDCCQNQQKNTIQAKSSDVKQGGFSFIKNKIFIYCVLGISGALIAIYIFKVPGSTLLTFGFLLLCPLIHLFMMKGHSTGNHHANNENTNDQEKVKH